MQSRYGKDTFILRSCLSEKVISEFNWIDDYDIMWNRLDSKFGSSPKIVDYVVNSFFFKLYQTVIIQNC